MNALITWISLETAYQRWRKRTGNLWSTRAIFKVECPLTVKGIYKLAAAAQHR